MDTAANSERRWESEVNMCTMRRLRHLLLAALLLFTTVIISNPAWGKVNITGASSVSPFLGPYLNIWTDAVDNVNEAVVYNSVHDEYLTVWTSWQDGYTHDIWGRRISGDSTLLSWFCIATSAGEHLEYADAAYSPNQDRYFVVFHNPYDYNPDDIDLYAVTFDYDGTDFSSFLTVDDASYKQQYPTVAYNVQNDEFLVVYNNELASGCTEVAARRFNAQTGLPLDVRHTISSCAVGNNRSFPDVAYNPTRNNYLIAYKYDQVIPYRAYIGAKIASNDLSTLSPEFQLSGEGISPYLYPVSVAAGQDEYLAAWANSTFDIYARRVNYDGTLPVAGNGFPVSFTTHPDTRELVQVSASSLGYRLVWVNETISPFIAKIYGNFVPLGSDLAPSVELPIDADVNAQTLGRIACRWQGRCLVTDGYNPIYPAGDFDIHGRFLYPFGLYLPQIVR
jgi:hypothetical protein